ncbi:MAG: hypothetical protein WBY93_00915 [Candidatus Binatus sp.]
MAARRNNHQEPDLDGQLRDRRHRATDLVTQLHMYILVAGPEAAMSRSQPPSSRRLPGGDGTPRALGRWLTGLGHNITSDSGGDPVVTAWQWLAGHQAFEVGQAGARRVMRHLAGQDAAGT